MSNEVRLAQAGEVVVDSAATGAAAVGPWQPDSWRGKPIQQQPEYAQPQELSAVLETLRAYPPLVFGGEIERLRQQLAEAAAGRRFLLQGGDCSERFVDCTAGRITNTLKILLQMSLVVAYASRRPVLRLGRMAGQYAKPRSSPVETIDGQTMLSFRGDNVHAFEATPAAREPDPRRLLQSYHLSALTLNYVRALIAGGFADLHHPEHWRLDFLAQSPDNDRYRQILANLRDAIAFMDSVGGVRAEVLGTVEFYTSHEALLLGFEQAMTRCEPPAARWYNLGAHLLWIGDRTRGLDDAHVEYCRGLANPLGVKLGPSADADTVRRLLERLDPYREPGRLVLISRMGVAEVARRLPTLVDAVQRDGRAVVWSVDPMHGNTIKSAAGVKTRDFSSILQELRDTFEIHRSLGSRLNGVHIELTGEDVTECIGGSERLSHADLHRQYETYCDPRLNYNQSLELAFVLADLLRTHQPPAEARPR